MNAYEEKKKARIERLRERAEKKREFASQNDLSLYGEDKSGIPLGQPILVGHHSERRHRRHLERIENRVRKGMEAYDEANRLEAAADAAEANRNISSDNPDALRLLEEKYKKLETMQERMKAANKFFKKPKTDFAIEELIKLGLTRENAIAGFEPDFAGRIGFPEYALQNNRARMTATKKRIEELKKLQERPELEVKARGLEVKDNKELNRTQLFFDGKPSDEEREFLKRNGFRWSPFNGCWQRNINNATTYAVRTFIEKFRKE